MAVTTKDRESRARLTRRVPRGRATSPTFLSWKDLPLPEALAVQPPAPLYPAIGFLERLFALGCLVVASPFLLLIGLGIKITSPGGPVLFKQERVGLNRRQRGKNGDHPPGVEERRRSAQPGQIFHIYKFRTMIPDAEKRTGPVWATDKDPRVTQFGHILRRLRLDEVPQLINVVRGQMSLIGPRPERPFFVQQLSEQIPEYPERLRVLPGITGLAQIERSYDGSVDDVKRKLRYDLYYAKNKSPILDAKILISTIDVMLRGRGAR